MIFNSIMEGKYHNSSSKSPISLDIATYFLYIYLNTEFMELATFQINKLTVKPSTFWVFLSSACLIFLPNLDGQYHFKLSS